MPPSLHRGALAAYGQLLKQGLEHVAGAELEERSWHLAQLGLAKGGLGVRDPGRHAAGAYIASLAQTRDLCQRIDSAFDVTDAAGGLCLADATAEVRNLALEAAALDRGNEPVKQKEISSLLDASFKQQILANNGSDPTFLTHLTLCSVPGAGTWLTAPPVPDGRAIDTPLFRVDLQRRLRVPIFPGDGVCMCCGEAMDRYGDHALTCCCHGDRTLRHNAVRDVLYEEAANASLKPEREKAGLLPKRPTEDGLGPEEASRRPADVWLPRGVEGGAEALDFAVTSGLQASWYRQAADDPNAVFEHYEALKRNFKQTHQACQTHRRIELIASHRPWG